MLFYLPNYSNIIQCTYLHIKQSPSFSDSFLNAQQDIWTTCMRFIFYWNTFWLTKNLQAILNFDFTPLLSAHCNKEFSFSIVHSAQILVSSLILLENSLMKSTVFWRRSCNATTLASLLLGNAWSMAARTEWRASSSFLGLLKPTRLLASSPPK